MNGVDGGLSRVTAGITIFLRSLRRSLSVMVRTLSALGVIRPTWYQSDLVYFDRTDVIS